MQQQHWTYAGDGNEDEDGECDDASGEDDACSEKDDDNDGDDNCHYLPLPSVPPASLPLACYRQQIAAAKNTTVCRKKSQKKTHGIGVGIAILG